MRRQLKTAVLMLLLLAGCGGAGPETGEVAGRVTLDGQPLSGAVVEFTPQSGRPSFGMTDDDGRYMLGYTRDVEGALIGEHAVRITTSDPFADNPEDRRERVPPMYNQQTTLSAIVDAGENTLDFNLKSRSSE